MTFTREQWLVGATDLIVKYIFTNEEIPKFRVGCGLPTRRAFSLTRRTLGQCFDHRSSKDKHYEIFISPTLDDPIQIINVLIHELIHAIVGTEAKHGGAFKTLARDIGLEGKLTSTELSPDLLNQAQSFISILGPYPGAELLHLDLSLSKPRRKSQIKLTCNQCGYVLRTTRVWVQKGLPSCCCSGEFIKEKEIAEES